MRSDGLQSDLTSIPFGLSLMLSTPFNTGCTQLKDRMERRGNEKKLVVMSSNEGCGGKKGGKDEGSWLLYFQEIVNFVRSSCMHACMHSVHSVHSTCKKPCKNGPFRALYIVSLVQP